MRTVVCIPTKNRSEPLARTLDRLASLRPPPQTLICDQTTVPTDPRPQVQVDHRPDLNGLPAARNVLLEHTEGAEAIIFIDDDTDLAPGFLDAVHRLLVREPQCAAWGPVIETRGRWTRRLHRLIQLGCFRDDRRLTAGPCDRPANALFGCCFVVRRDAAVSVRGFDARLPGYALGEDFDFFLRLGEAGHRARFSAALRAHHRRDGEDRADPHKRGRAKARFLLRTARRHGKGNPATLIHLLLALLAAASGRGQEPASLSGLLSGLWWPRETGQSTPASPR